MGKEKDYQNGTRWSTTPAAYKVVDKLTGLRRLPRGIGGEWGGEFVTVNVVKSAYATYFDAAAGLSL